MIGVCLPLALLRRLINKGVRGQALADDEIHVGAVAECGARNRVSNLLQEAPPPPLPVASAPLADKTVLCVGGRNVSGCPATVA